MKKDKLKELVKKLYWDSGLVTVSSLERIFNKPHSAVKRYLYGDETDDFYIGLEERFKQLLRNFFANAGDFYKFLVRISSMEAVSRYFFIKRGDMYNIIYGYEKLTDEMVLFYNEIKKIIEDYIKEESDGQV